MSGAANRRRGADAERAVVAWLREHGYPDARRYLAGDGRQPGDIDAIPGVCIEVKDRKQSAWPTWIRQAVLEAGQDRLAVVVRRSRGKPAVGEWEARWVTFRSYIDGELYSVNVKTGTFGEFIASLEDDAPAAVLSGKETAK